MEPTIARCAHRLTFPFAIVFAMVAWLAAGIASAQTVFIDEDFATATGSTPPAGWSNDTLVGLASDKWRFDNPGNRFLVAPITSPAAIFDSDATSANGTAEDVVLTSPSVDTTGHPVVWLRWSHHFQAGFGGSPAVEVWNGSAWVEVYATLNTTANPELQDIDVSAHAGDRASVAVRFRWRGNYSWYWIVDNVQLYAPAPPGVAIDQAPAQADPASASPITFQVVFSEDVTGFDGSDVSLAGSTATGPFTVDVTGSGATYEVTVSGMTSNGTVVASIPAGVATSVATGLPNAASTSTDNTVTFSDPPPTVTIDQAAAQADPATASPINFTVVFSEPVTGFDGGDVSFAGSTAAGPLTAVVTGGPSTYNVAVSGMTGNGTVVATIPAGAAIDAFGSDNQASTSTDNVVTYAGVDVTPPTVTIDQAPGQADPATAAPILFTVTFSEPVTGFDGADISFAGSTAPGILSATVTGGPAIYTVAVSGMTGSGTVAASIPAGAAVDASGNASLGSASTDNSVAFHLVRTTFSAPSATGTGTITAAFTGGGPTCSFDVAQFIAPPPGAPPVPPTAPEGVTFPHGLFDFTTTGCTPGSTLTFTITYPSAPGTVYWKYGPTPSDATPHWYVLPANIVGNVVTFSITDGGLGDDDLAANGAIVDQGGPGTPGAAGASPVPTLGQWAMLLLACLMLLTAVPAMKRRM